MLLCGWFKLSSQGKKPEYLGKIAYMHNFMYMRLI